MTEMVGWDDKEISHHDLRAGPCRTFAPKQQVKHRKALNAACLGNLREGTRLISEEWIAEKKRELKDAAVKAARLRSFSSWEQRATHTLHGPFRGLLQMLLEPPGPPKAAAPAACALVAPAHHRFRWPEESTHGATTGQAPFPAESRS